MIYDKVEDTFFEAFEGKYVRALITGPSEEIVKRAAYDSTSTPSAVIGRVEGGVEGFLSKDETPDGRFGAVVQYWLGGDDKEKFAFELSYRLRQDVLVKPFTRIFDYSESDGDDYIEMMDIVGHCGDGWEWIVEEYGRRM
ncbi:MAG: formylmethanofuran--tetrahydromethanopterin formyltransferase, partial [Methanobrevibacter sp.]|nr:formylmethanofuran--tetrahydromethanopterin formyltransferase [Methanobrevibacter sp.]